MIGIGVSPFFPSGVPSAVSPTASANVPTLVVSDVSQQSGDFVAGDTLLAVATTSDTDGHTTTGVDLYESGALVGAMIAAPGHTWRLSVGSATAGAKSYVARRNYSGGSRDSAAYTLTVLGGLAPDQIASATLMAWCRVPESIQMGGTMTSAAGGQPAVTLTTSGTFVGRTEGVFVRIKSTGARGVATFDCSLQNDGPLVITGALTAATVAIPGTDLTLNFATGTYNNTNTYQAICNHFLDKVGSYPTSTNNWDNVNADDTRPFIRTSGDLGAAAIRFDGSNDFLNCTGTVGTAWANGTNHAFYVMALIYVRALPTGSNSVFWYSASNTTDTDLPFVRLGISTTSSLNYWSSGRRSDTGTQVGKDSNVVAWTGQALIEDSYDGTNRRVTWNSADVVGGDSGVAAVQSSAGALTTTQMTLGCQWVQSGKSQFMNFDLYELIVFNQRPSDEDVLRLRAYIYQ